jgi:hypothetical protein
VSDRDLYVVDKSVSIISPLLLLPSRDKHTLAAKSIVRSKTIESGSIVLVIDLGLQGGEGDKVIGRGVLDPLATEGSSRWVVVLDIFDIYTSHATG